eukprot:5717770-Prymnesium_polylepis.1
MLPPRSAGRPDMVKDFALSPGRPSGLGEAVRPLSTSKRRCSNFAGMEAEGFGCMLRAVQLPFERGRPQYNARYSTRVPARTAVRHAPPTPFHSFTPAHRRT